MARGLTSEEATTAAGKPYVQEWKPTGNDKKVPEWTVTTYQDDGVTPCRVLHYPCGDWEERYHGVSTLFGDNDDDNNAKTLQRRTFYAPTGP